MSLKEATPENKRTILLPTVQEFRMIDRRVQILRTVASRGTVTAAADALGYTPSAISHQLRTLSRDLGIRLLEPDGRRVQLTLAARLLLRGADELSIRWEELLAELATVSGESRGRLTMCGFSTASALMPAAASAVKQAHPYTTVRIVEANPEECFDLLLTEHADLAVVVATSGTPSLTDKRFEQQSLLDDPLDLLVHVDHRFASRRSVPMEETAQENWILDRVGRPYRNLVVAACTYAGFTPTVAHEAVEWDTGAALVGAGLGVAMVPRLARLPADDRIVRVPLAGEPTPARHVLTAVRRGSAEQPVIRTALAALRDVAAQVVG